MKCGKFRTSQKRAIRIEVKAIVEHEEFCSIECPFCFGGLDINKSVFQYKCQAFKKKLKETKKHVKRCKECLAAERGE